MVKMKGKFVSRQKLMAQLLAIEPEIAKQLAAVQLESGKQLAAQIRQRAPRSTGAGAGAYQRSINAAYLREKPHLAKYNRVASQTKDPNAVGIYANYIWRWLEYGTAQHSTAAGARRAVKGAAVASGAGTHPGMPAQPHINPTYRMWKKNLGRANSRVVNRAVRAAIKRTGG